MSLDDEIAAARERADSAAEREQRAQMVKAEHETQKRKLIRAAIGKLLPFGNETFVLVQPMRRMKFLASYIDDNGGHYRRVESHRCWNITPANQTPSLPTVLLLENGDLGEFIEPRQRIYEVPAPRHHEYLSLTWPMRYSDVYTFLSEVGQANLDMLKRHLADAIVRYEKAKEPHNPNADRYR